MLGDRVILEMATIKIGILPQAKRLKINRLLCQIKAISHKIPLYESSMSYDMVSHIQSIVLPASILSAFQNMMLFFKLIRILFMPIFKN